MLRRHLTPAPEIAFRWLIMTAAFAKELGLQVTYQSAYLEETWGRSGDLLVRSGHVNVTLDRKMGDRNTIGSSSQ